MGTHQAGLGRDLSSLLYSILRLIGLPFRYRVTGEEKLPPGGAALYIANHRASAGPLAVILSLPVRFYPWVIAEMTDHRRAPAYIYDDFIQPEWHLHGRLGRVAAAVIGRLAALLLKSIGCVSVEKNAGFPLEAYRQSLELLEAGQSLLIFPEISLGETDPLTMMRPFECGFAALGRLYFELTSIALPVYILAVHPESRRISLDRGPSYQRRSKRRLDDHEFCTLLEGKLREQYLELTESWNEKNAARSSVE